MKISVIVVNYNKPELLRNCLFSLKKNDYPSFDIIVVDNGSSDCSLSMLKEQFPEVDVLEMGYNSGFCKANNVGIRYALDNGSDSVILLNNDTEVDHNFIKEMAEAIDVENKIGMIAAKVIFMGDKSLIDSAGLQITPDGLAKNRGLLEDINNYDSISEVFCPAGAAALYTREVLEDVEEKGQYLDESFEYYFEELDLGWRARLCGWRCAYSPDAVVYHIKSATSGAYSEFVAYYTNRNNYYNIIKNYPFLNAVKALILAFLRYLFLSFGIILKKGAGDKINKKIGFTKLITVTLRGLGDVLKNFKVMYKKRKAIQANRRASKKEIESWFDQFGLTYLESIYK